MNNTTDNNTSFISIQDENNVLRDEKRQLLEENKYLKFQVEQLKKVIFGSKRDSVPSKPVHEGQLHLFETPVQFEEEPKEEEPKKKLSRRAKRKAIPKHFEEREILLKVPPAQQIDAHGNPLVVVGHDISERLGRIPGKFVRVVIKREKVGYPDSRQVLHTAEPLKAIVPKGKFMDDFIQEIVVQKYWMGLPLYRQIQSYNAEGANLSKSTLSETIQRFAEFYEPVAMAILKEIVKGKWIQGDETPIKCQGLTKDELKRTYFWAFRNLFGCYFHYGVTRSQEEIQKVFEAVKLLKPCGRKNGKQDLIQWKGYLMTDGYSAYGAAIEESEVIQMGCWAHVRREFVPIYEADPLEQWLVEQIKLVYKVEEKARELGKEKNWSDSEFYGERGKLRNSESRPLVEGSLKKVKEAWESGKYTPASAMGEALRYAYNLEEKLKVFLTDGELPIDNNGVEQRMRGVVIGRKNYLFVGSEDAGTSAAVCYTLMETCRMLEIEPREYLTKSTVGLLEGIAPERLTPLAMKEELKKIPTNF